MKKYIILILLAITYSCGTLLDFTGRGSKTKCLKFNTSNFSISCSCTNKDIQKIIIYKNKNDQDKFGQKILEINYKQELKSLELPLPKDSVINSFLQIEIKLNNTHHRESFYIETKPNDFRKNKLIYARYFSH